MKDENAENSNKEDVKDAKKKSPISINIFSYIKIIIVLAVVILIIYGLSLILKRSLGIKGAIHENADIIINQSLGQGKWIQVIRICGKYLVLGITNENVNLLTEIKDKNEIERFEVVKNEKKVQSGNNFLEMITEFFKNKLKKDTNKEKFDYEVDSVSFLNKQKDRLDKLK